MAPTVELRPDLAPRLEALRLVCPNETPVLEVRELWGTDDWQGGIVRISGMIEAGDLDELKALAGSPNGEDRLPRPLHVLLDSPGSSLTTEYLAGTGTTRSLKRNSWRKGRRSCRPTALTTRAGSIGSATVGRVQAGSKVTVTDCAVTEDAQGVWFRISGRGQDGWVSARFVSRREREANLLNLIRPIGFE